MSELSSLESERQNHLERTPESIRNIALPVDIPQPPSLDQVPTRILHAATVETLISHNDDLSSRLKVHIRRNSQLEGRLIELELDLEQSENIRHSLSSQIEILKEKDKAFSERSFLSEARLSKLKEDLDLAKTEVVEIQRRNRDLVIREAKAWAYKRRVQRWVRPGLIARQREIDRLTALFNEQQAESGRLTATLAVLRQELQHSRSEADRKLAGFEKDRARLVDQYESQVAELKSELKTTKGELAKVSERAITLERVTSDSARTTNERVFFERRAEELEVQLKQETARLRGTIEDLGRECASLRASNETIRSLKETAEAQAQDADQSRSRSESQLQSLREIWKETSVRLQAVELKNEALEKLNAELSRKLQEAREKSRQSFADNALERVGFIEDNPSHTEKLKRLDSLLSDLEMKAFGINPADLHRPPPLPPVDKSDEALS